MEHKIIAMHLIPAVVEGPNGRNVVFLDFRKNRVFSKDAHLIPEEEMKDVYEVFKKQRIVMPELPSGIADKLIQLKKEMIDGSQSNELKDRHLESKTAGKTRPTGSEVSEH